MTDAEKTALVESIIDRNLEDVANWTKPTLKMGPGPFFPEVFTEFEQAREQVTLDLRRVLLGLDFTVLRAEYDLKVESFCNPLANPHGVHFALVKRLTKLKASRPPWFAGGLNVQEKKADQDYWGSFASFSLEQASLLSFGVDPEAVDFDAMFKFYGRDQRTDLVLYNLEDRFEAIARGLDCAPEQEAHVEADRFFEWIRAYNVPVDNALKRRINKRPRRNSLLPVVVNNLPEPRLNRRTYIMAAQVVTGMAMDKYGLEGSASVSRVANKIEGMLPLHGLTCDARGLKNLLRAGLDQQQSNLRKPD